jgi:anti-anti-sigma factor
VPLENQHEAGTCRSGGQAVPPDSTCVVMALPAEIDIANADLVRADLLSAISAGNSVIIADLSRCSFCDCAGAEALLAVGADAKLHGAQLRVVAPAGPVLRILELTGLTQAVPVYPTRSAAARSGVVPAGTVVTPLHRILCRHLPGFRRRQDDAAGFAPQPDPPRSL